MYDNHTFCLIILSNQSRRMQSFNRFLYLWQMRTTWWSPIMKSSLICQSVSQFMSNRKTSTSFQLSQYNYNLSNNNNKIKQLKQIYYFVKIIILYQMNYCKIINKGKKCQMKFKFLLANYKRIIYYFYYLSMLLFSL